MPSQITAGRVRLALDGKQFILEPTLRAITDILWQYGEFSAVYAKLITNHDVDAIVFVIRCGLGATSNLYKNPVNLYKTLYRNGITEELLASLIEYLAVLANGGKPPVMDDEGKTQRTKRDTKRVSLESWCDRLLQQATGWLRWPADAALDTPIGQLELALEGHVEYRRKTNPFRSKKDIDDERLLEQMEAGAGREEGAQAFLDWAKRMQAAQADTSRTIDDD